MNRIPGASSKGVAALATVVIIGTPTGAFVVLGSRLDASVQAAVLVFASLAGFWLVVLTVSLLAGMTGSVTFAAAVPLLAFAHPDISVWACMGIAAGIGYLDGILSGVALKPHFVS